MKNRTHINFIIDILLWIAMAAVGGIGFLMKFILVPGSERWVKYGSNAECYIRGWDRHQWGGLHLILSYILIGLLILHIVFHWYQIKCMFKKLVPSRAARVTLTVIAVPLTLLLFLFSFLLPVTMDEIKTGEGRHRVEISRSEAVEQMSETEPVQQQTIQAAPHEEEHESRTLEIFGSSTLNEISKKYSVPSDSMKKYLGIPINISDNERLGRLRRQYDFHMSTIERYIEDYHKRHSKGE